MIFIRANSIPLKFLELIIVSTFYVEFSFPEPYTVVLGGPDMHVDQGSTINLTCVSKFNPMPPSDVTWYLNGKVKKSLLEIEIF